MKKSLLLIVASAMVFSACTSSGPAVSGAAPAKTAPVTAPPQQSVYYVDQLAAKGDYRSVVLTLYGVGFRAVQTAGGGADIEKTKFWGEPYDKAMLRAKNLIVADNEAYKPAILELLSGTIDDRFAALTAAQLVFDRDYLTAVAAQLLYDDPGQKNPSIELRQSLVHYFIPDGKVGADYRTYPPELKLEIVNLLLDLLTATNDFNQIISALSVIRYYGMPEAKPRLQALRDRFDPWSWMLSNRWKNRLLNETEINQVKSELDFTIMKL